MECYKIRIPSTCILGENQSYDFGTTEGLFILFIVFVLLHSPPFSLMKIQSSLHGFPSLLPSQQSCEVGVDGVCVAGPKNAT